MPEGDFGECGGVHPADAGMAWLAGLAATEGRKDGLAAVMGIAVGLMGNGLLAALGLAALLQAAPGLWIALRLGGAVMMVWLAFATIVCVLQESRPDQGATANRG